VLDRHICHNGEGNPIIGRIQDIALKVPLGLIGHHLYVIHAARRRRLSLRDELITFRVLARSTQVGNGRVVTIEWPGIRLVLPDPIVPFVPRVPSLMHHDTAAHPQIWQGKRLPSE